MDKIIGIDLGTTNSVVAVMDGGKPKVIPNQRGDRITPSVVAFTEEGEILVGQPAKNQSIINRNCTITSIKRKIGTKHKKKINKRAYSPEEISAIILSKLRQSAEEYFNENISKAIITVPAYFNDSQRQATITAGKIAGLDVLRIINEPTAAALAYGLNTEEEQCIIVFDLGGGTYDVSILELGEGIFEVRATNGINKLGGDDFDDRFVEYIVESFKKESGINLQNDLMAMQRIREEAIKAKIELSESFDTQINIPFITADEKGPKHLSLRITRAKFEELIKDLVEQMEAPLKIAMEDAKITSKNIDKVILVGGSTRIPFVQDFLRNILEKELFRGINPDECVAMGAALQAGIITGEKKGTILVDVIPLTLGIEVENGEFAPVIDRNTPVPVSKKRMFTTIADDQHTVKVNVYQGERKYARGNSFLGEFNLTGIRPALKGDPQIEVTFDVNVDGVVHVAAKDLDTGIDQSIKITGSQSLPEDEIERLIEEAKRMEQKDIELRQLAMLKNEAEKLVVKCAIVVEEKRESSKENDSLEGLISDIIEASEELDRAVKSSEKDVIHSMIETVQTLIDEIEGKDITVDEEGTEEIDLNESRSATKDVDTGEKNEKPE